MEKAVLKSRLKQAEIELKQSFNNEALLAGVCNATNKWLLDNQANISVPVDSDAARELAELLQCYSVILENYSFNGETVQITLPEPKESSGEQQEG